MVRVASTTVGSLLDAALPAFGAAHPNFLVQVDAVIGQTPLDAAFTDDSYAAVCCREREVLPDGREFTQLYHAEMVMMVGPTHPPLAEKARFSMEGL